MCKFYISGWIGFAICFVLMWFIIANSSTFVLDENP